MGQNYIRMLDKMYLYEIFEENMKKENLTIELKKPLLFFVVSFNFYTTCFLADKKNELNCLLLCFF